MVSSEPRMELLPEEWQALADLEAAAREVDEHAGVDIGGVPSLRRLRGALAQLDAVRGRLHGEPRNRGIGVLADG